MRRGTALGLYVVGVAAFVLAVEVPDWHAPVAGTQIGPDGTGMVQFADTSPWRVSPAPGDAAPAAAAGGPPATEVYRNVKVLTDVSAAEFMRLQTAMTEWVSPRQGCAFCHSGADFASDANPMKDVTRDMLRMTRRINTTWRSHAGGTGVTCFSCHRGEPVPPETWFPRQARPTRPFVARSENWDETADTVRKFFPDNGWALYLLHDEPIRGEAKTALPEGTAPAQVETKRVYEMMMQMSDGIGVNCGFCHSSRAFSDWSQSTPSRWVAYEAIRMMRDLNLNYLAGLRATMPQSRELVRQNDLALPPSDRNPRGGTGLAVCATCHYGHIHPEAGSATIGNHAALASAVNADPVPHATAAPPRPSDTAQKDLRP